MKTAHASHWGYESPWRLFWIALLSAVLALLLTVAAGGGEPRTRVSGDWSQAVGSFRGGEFEQAAALLHGLTDGGSQQYAQPALVDQGLLVWKALTAQAQGEHLLATNAWQRAILPNDQTPWRHVALAALALEQGLTEEAAVQLSEAHRRAPDNAVVRYFTGLLHLERAAGASEWPDAVGPSDVRLAVHLQTDVLPNTRSMYLLAASQEFEQAIELPAVALNVPLVAIDETVEPVLRPTVGDLLIAAGAENYPVRAHHMLSSVYVERGLLALAEHHLDRAAAGGAPIMLGYSELAAAYRQEGEFASAGRAHLKAAEHGDAPITNLQKAWWSFRQATRR